MDHESKNSGISLAALVLLYKGEANTELVNAESWPQGEREGQGPGASSHNISIGQSIHDLVFRVFLFKGTFFNGYCRCAGTGRLTHSAVSRGLNEVYLTQEGTSQPLGSGTPCSTRALG